MQGEDRGTDEREVGVPRLADGREVWVPRLKRNIDEGNDTQRAQMSLRGLEKRYHQSPDFQHPDHLAMASISPLAFCRMALTESRKLAIRGLYLFAVFLVEEIRVSVYNKRQHEGSLAQQGHESMISPWTSHLSQLQYS